MDPLPSGLYHLLARNSDSSPSWKVIRVFGEVTRIGCPEDGVFFDPAGILAEAIQLDTEYGGIRVKVPGRFGTARFSVQVDLGFGDAITPAPQNIAFPTWLETLPAPAVLGCPLETIVAEKSETLFRRREANSRVRGWFDLWLLAKTRSFDGTLLQRAISNTFKRRLRPFKDDPERLYHSIAANPRRAANWSAFRNSLSEAEAPADLAAVFDCITRFLDPILQACARDGLVSGRWVPEEQLWRNGQVQGDALDGLVCPNSATSRKHEALPSPSKTADAWANLWDLNSMAI